MQKIRALVIKEFLQIARDPSSIIIAVILPLFLLFVYGYGISLDIKNLKIGVIDEDKSPKISNFLSSLQQSSYFSIQYFDNVKDLSKKMESGKLAGYIQIPSYYSAFAKNADSQAPIFVAADGSTPNTATFVTNYIAAAYRVWQSQEIESYAKKQPPIVQLEPRFWYNEELSSRHFLVPGSIASIMTLIGTLLTALVIAREWERGTIESLMTTPITIWEILLGKVIPYYCLGMISMIICTLSSYFLFDVPFRGNFLMLFMTSSIFLLTALGTGLLISSMTKNQFVASQIAMISGFLPAFILSGFIFEITSMPLPIRILSYLLPARYFVSSLKTIFLVGTVWPLLLLNLLIMSFFVILLFVIIGLTSVKRLD